jgi:TolA-binding protein
MKRIFSLSTIFLALQLPLFAQSSSTAAALADKQDAEERYNRMAADVQALQAANTSLQKKISALEDQISKLSEGVSKANNNSSVSDDLKLLKDKIQEVDKKRESDKQVIQEDLKKFFAQATQELKAKPVARSTPKADKETHSSDATLVSDKEFSHTIEDGETLLAILKAYNAKFKSEGMKPIKLKQIEDANPGVDWNRLKIGQKIVIPAPAG